MKHQKSFVTLIFICLISAQGFAQEINLADKFQNKQISAVNRIITVFGDDKNAIEMDAKDSDGMGILDDIEFDQGVIEVELLGENNPGKSFIGIAFNIENDSTFEAIYFRPFNFVAKEQIRKDHMVQYIFHPEFSWRKLRNERTGEFEAEISTPPNPDDWFKAIIKVSETKVEVYVNDLSTLVLSVDRLNSTKTNKLGVWTGFGSSGRFRNLVLKSK